MTPSEVLARHGSSFHMAARVLRRQDAADIAILYAACRLIDDLADEQTGQAGRIHTILEALRNGEPEAVPIEGFAEMSQRRQLALKPLATLAEMAWKEAKAPQQIADEDALINYCYAVAGTVGEMMCPLLGADPMRGREAAIALGIGMQLTNISRDVLEDAEQGRRYLPGTWVGDISPALIAEARPINREPVRSAIRRTVDLAETYYKQAESGFSLIPFRNRQAIRVATGLYRAIGLRVVERGCRYWEGRVSLDQGERARLALTTLTRIA